MKRIYLAGPMSGYPQFNFPAFDAAEADLLARGYDVVPPFDLHDPEIRPLCMASPDGAPGSLGTTTWGYALARDVEIIADQGIEAIAVLDNWQRSKGARLEVFVARLCGLPIYNYFGPGIPLESVPKQTLKLVIGGVA